jgi:O-Glycosyl hydrolase
MERRDFLIGMGAALVLGGREQGASSSGAPQTVRVNLRRPRQRIEGFGSAFIVWAGPRPFYNDAVFDLATKDLGVSLLRIPMAQEFEGPNDDNDPNHFHWPGYRLGAWSGETGIDYRVGLLKAFKDRGVTRFLASTWSPPAYCKTQRGVTNGGYLRMDRMDEFAEYMAAWVILAKKNYGVDIGAVTLQNELLFNHTFRSCVYHGYGVREQVRAVMRKFKREGITSQILIPEDMMMVDRMLEYIQPTMQDPETRNFPGHFCTHRLGGFDAVRKWREATAPYQRQTWMTETSGHPQTWDGALKMASDMHDYLVGGDISAWVYWQLTDTPRAGAYALMVDGKPSPKYYAAKHFYRYVRPGAVRVESTLEQGEVVASAYRHDADGTLTLVLINKGAAPAEVVIEVEGGTAPASFRRFVSTAEQGGAGEGCREVEPVSGGTGRLTLPPRSIVTLTGEHAGLKTARQAPEWPEAWRIPADAKPTEIWGTPGPIDAGTGFAIGQAAAQNRLPGVRAEIEKGNLNATYGDGRNALHAALLAGAGDAAKLLIESGIDVNHAAKDGWTPLHMAAGSFGAGGDNREIGRGYTLLDLLNLVLAAKPNPIDPRTDDGWTPLHSAAANARDDSGPRRIAALIEAGAEVDAKDANGRTPLHWAAWQGFMGHILFIRHEAVQELINRGAKVDATDALGRTPLHYAAEMGYERIVAALLLAGANPNARDAKGDTPESLTRKNALGGIVDLLTGKRPPQEVLPDAPAAPRPAAGRLGAELIRAATRGDVAEVKALLARGADVTYRDGDGFTALDRARDNNHTEVVRLLTEAMNRAKPD